jgi:predicted PurR-regulated permease PerM
MDQEKINQSVLLLSAVAISALFLAMIRHFVMAIFLAGIFSSMAHPLYRRLAKLFKGSQNLASLVTLLVVVIVVLIPVGILTGMVVSEAIKVGQSVTPWVKNYIADPGAMEKLRNIIPFYETIEPYRGLIFNKAGEVVATASTYLIGNLSSATIGTVNFIFMGFIFLYTTFFFLTDGDKLLEKILYYLPMKVEDEQRLISRFTSVTRATLKGTAVIGILQGSLAGVAFSAAGIPSAVFWGTLMTLLSIIPGIGAALVWAPAAVILAISGNYVKAAGLFLFCGLVVGGLDNFLRPRLVGKDSQLHELLILFSTMGGIAMFGILGFVIGPILASLFVTIWDIYGVAFQGILPRTRGVEQKPENDDFKSRDA